MLKPGITIPTVLHIAVRPEIGIVAMVCTQIRIDHHDFPPRFSCDNLARKRTVTVVLWDASGSGTVERYKMLA
jgi:hypothetical protein